MPFQWKPPLTLHTVKKLSICKFYAPDSWELPLPMSSVKNMTVFWWVVIWLLHTRNYLIQLNKWIRDTDSQSRLKTLPLGRWIVSVTRLIYLFNTCWYVWILISPGRFSFKSCTCPCTHTVLTSMCDSSLKYFCRYINLYTLLKRGVWWVVCCHTV